MRIAAYDAESNKGTEMAQLMTTPLTSGTPKSTKPRPERTAYLTALKAVPAGTSAKMPAMISVRRGELAKWAKTGRSQ